MAYVTTLDPGPEWSQQAGREWDGDGDGVGDGIGLKALPIQFVCLTIAGDLWQ